ncbi:MAG: adenine phosphoribosyltransferase [Chlorobi bacterium]|nr:adenine phosphoribosyltransferase [Chlorobiota bacterium]
MNIKELEQEVKGLIREIPDFPVKGILFKDIMPVLRNPQVCNKIIRTFESVVRDWNGEVIAGIESRGFFFGPSVAFNLGLPFVPVRKVGKLPGDTVAVSYNLEYGTATIEMHSDAIQPGQRVIIHDDLLATGGTAEAAAQLVQKLGGQVAGFLFLVELDFLAGREILAKYSENIFSIVHYEK